jgi:hypothetical protein
MRKPPITAPKTTMMPMIANMRLSSADRTLFGALVIVLRGVCLPVWNADVLSALARRISSGSQLKTASKWLRPVAHSWTGIQLSFL